MAALNSIYQWYFDNFLNENTGPDLNNLWLVSITPQEGEARFLDILKQEAARFDYASASVQARTGIVTDYATKDMAKMVDATWKANVKSVPANLNVNGWGSNGILININQVDIPTDTLNTKNAEMGPGYTWVPPMLADNHAPFQPFQLQFYYTAYPFSEFIIRPWTMAVNRYGLKLRASRAHITCTLFTKHNQLYLGNTNWSPKFQYKFYSCYPQGNPQVQLNYTDDGQDKATQVAFGYDFYRIGIPDKRYLEPKPTSETEIKQGTFLKGLRDLVVVNPEEFDESGIYDPFEAEGLSRNMGGMAAVAAAEAAGAKPNEDDTPVPDDIIYVEQSLTETDEALMDVKANPAISKAVSAGVKKVDGDEPSMQANANPAVKAVNQSFAGPTENDEPKDVAPEMVFPDEEDEATEHSEEVGYVFANSNPIDGDEPTGEMPQKVLPPREDEATERSPEVLMARAWTMLRGLTMRNDEPRRAPYSAVSIPLDDEVQSFAYMFAQPNPMDEPGSITYTFAMPDMMDEPLWTTQMFAFVNPLDEPFFVPYIPGFVDFDDDPHHVASMYEFVNPLDDPNMVPTTWMGVNPDDDPFKVPTRPMGVNPDDDPDKVGNPILKIGPDEPEKVPEEPVSPDADDDPNEIPIVLEGVDPEDEPRDIGVAKPGIGDDEPRDIPLNVGESDPDDEPGDVDVTGGPDENDEPGNIPNVGLSVDENDDPDKLNFKGRKVNDEDDPEKVNFDGRDIPEDDEVEKVKMDIVEPDKDDEVEDNLKVPTFDIDNDESEKVAVKNIDPEYDEPNTEKRQDVLPEYDEPQIEKQQEVVPEYDEPPIFTQPVTQPEYDEPNMSITTNNPSIGSDEPDFTAQIKNVQVGEDEPTFNSIPAKSLGDGEPTTIKVPEIRPEVWEISLKNFAFRAPK